MERTQDQIIEIISGKLFNLLHHHKWTCEATCLAAIDDALKALDEAPLQSLSRAQHSYNLAVLMTIKFEFTDDLRDLHEAVEHAENAILIPDHAERGAYLSTLVDILLMRYRWIKNLGDLSGGILYAQMAVAQTPQGDPVRVRYLSKLVKLLELRYEAIDDISDLQNALYHATQAELESHDHSDRVRIACVSKLADLLFEKFKWMDSPTDLNMALSNAEEAFYETAEDHPDRPIYLYKLITILFMKFSRSDYRSDLEGAILYTKQTASELWHNPSLKALFKSEFLFEKLGSIPDEDKLKHALLLEIKAPEPHSRVRLYHLADTLFTKFKLMGDLDALEQAISNAEQAVKETPPSHRDRIIYLHKLVALLIARFKTTKGLDDLNLAILRIEEILSESQESSDRAIHFFMLEDILMEKFNLTNDSAVLESAMQRVRMAIVESQVGSLLRSACLAELAVILLVKFKSTNDLDDAGKALAYREKAIKEASMGHIRDVYLSKLPTTLEIGSDRVDGLGDPRLTISRSEVAVLLEDFHDSEDFSSMLPILPAKKLIPGNDSDNLDLDISRAEEDSVTKRGFAGRMESQSDFAVLLAQRFWLRKDHADLRRAISLWVDVFVYEWARTGESSHLQLAIHCIKNLIENDIILLPRAALLLGLEPRQEILGILDKAVFRPDELVQVESIGIKRTVTPLRLLSLAVISGRRKALPTFNATEILSVKEDAPLGSIKLGRLITGLVNSRRGVYDPQIPLGQIKSTVINHLEEATPDEDWESLRTKVFNKNSQTWTFEYKAQTFKLCDDDTIFPTAYALPKTRVWIGSSKTVHLVTGYQTCVSEDLMKLVAAEEMEAKEAVKRGRIFSIRYVKLVL